MLGVKDNLFAKIVPSLTIAGSTLPDINRELQMDPVQVIHVAGHDTASALAALPIEDDYSVFMSCGTWSLIGIPVKKALTTPNARRWGFTNEGTMDGTYRLLKKQYGDVAIAAISSNMGERWDQDKLYGRKSIISASNPISIID